MSLILSQTRVSIPKMNFQYMKACIEKELPETFLMSMEQSDDNIFAMFWNRETSSSFLAIITTVTQTTTFKILTENEQLQKKCLHIDYTIEPGQDRQTDQNEIPKGN